MVNACVGTVFKVVLNKARILPLIMPYCVRGAMVLLNDEFVFLVNLRLSCIIVALLWMDNPYCINKYDFMFI